MALEDPSPRRRYSPEKRRALILDAAADLVGREGVSGLNAERIARHAGISKSLIYNYFPNITLLLQQLFERELRRLRRRQLEAAEQAESFEGLVRAVTHVYLEYIDERGLIIERLQSEPSVAAVHDPTEYGRAAAVDYLARIVMRQFDLAEDMARAATDISLGLPAAAGAYLLHHDMDRQQLEDITVTMILGSFAAIKAAETARRPLARP
jgi:TetR/AcrR family transcriptional regulator, fatty acid biosynthesis regulator